MLLCLWEQALNIHFVMVRVGDRYAPEYVAILADMIARNASTLKRFSIWCVTDRPDELPGGVGYIPADQSIPPSWWAKLQLFSPDMPWEEGDRVVYFDLDVAITGRLEDLVERKGIIKDWHWPKTYNSSVMVWDHGEHRDAWETFTPEVMTRPSDELAPYLPKGQINGGDQEHLTRLGGWDTFPAEWFISYRRARDWPPNESKAVIFHGNPKPHEVTTGWVPNVWKIGGYTSLPVMNGVNVTHEALLENVRANCERDLPWFTGFGPHKGVAVVVGGAPSMNDNLSQIRAHKKRGARIVSVNNAWRTLMAAGIKPDVHVMLDARQENVEFVKDAPAGVRYMLASQVHPDVFEALKDREVIIWHNGFGDNEAMKEALAPWWDEGPNQRPCILVPGGGTVGLRALWLCALSGFKTVHIYGMDSSYEGDQHHAYAQPINDADAVMEVVLGGKRYRAARWMIRQTEEFRWHMADLKKEGVTLHVHGRGLLPDVFKAIREEERAA